MTPERMRVGDAMNSYDEGLTPRAYRCLLQLADGQQPTEADIIWLTDCVESSALARIGSDGRSELTAHGRLLTQAADRGDVEAKFALTTMPELLEATEDHG
jgi:hypothetical protein